MGHLVEHLRSRVERLRRSSGAASASAFLPSPWPDATEPVLVHTGEAEPVAELMDLARAQWLHQRHLESAGHDAATAALRIIASETPGGVLLPVPGSGDLTAAPVPLAAGRRLADREPVALAGWLGLRLPSGHAVAGAAPLSLADALGLANSLAHTFVALHTLRSDPLTGLPGRAELHSVVREGLRQAADRHHAFSLLMVNPDNFDQLNERLGRSAGDHALRELVVRTRGALRAADLVMRYGGAIFAIALPGTSAVHALAVAEKVRRALSSADYLAGRVEMRISAGTATWQPGDPEPRDPTEMIQRADSALALAKSAGGDRVQAWSPSADAASAPHVDRLGGVFTGDQNKDYRNLALLWDALAGAWSGETAAELAGRFAEQLLDVLRPAFVGLYEATDGVVGHVLAQRTSRDGDGGGGPSPRATATTADLDLLRAASASGTARHVIRHDGQCVLAIPVRAGSTVLGGLLMAGPVHRIRADAADLTFLEGFAAGMGIAIDRARLAGLERQRLEEERRRLAGELHELRSALQQVKLVYESPSVEEVVFDARRVADTDATLLITGESGTGKGLLAQTIHRVSRRRGGPYVVVDCSAIPANLLESELFGHERGAFTGAVTRSPGRIVQADGGTLLLDEVGEVPLEVQSKLLRFVEEKQFTSVGSHMVRRVDARVLAATNRDLMREVQAGRFRLDLYHRLSVVPLQLPPLRDRQQDVLLLARHFLSTFAAKYQKPAHRLSPDLERRMLDYQWPGNVRELQNRLLRAVLLADGEILTPAHMPLQVADLKPRGGSGEEDAVAAVRLANQGAAVAGDLPLGEALAVAVNAAAGAAPHLRPPLGRWLADDLVLVAFDECQSRACRAATALGLPDTTFARRLQRAQRDAGLAKRPPYWSAVSAAVLQLVRTSIAEPGGACVLDVAESALIEQIDRRFPGDPRAGAALLGTSLPTFRRRLTGLPLAS